VTPNFLFFKAQYISNLLYDSNIETRNRNCCQRDISCGTTSFAKLEIEYKTLNFSLKSH